MLKFANFDKKNRKTFYMTNDHKNKYGVYRFNLDQIQAENDKKLSGELVFGLKANDPRCHV